MTFPGKKDTLFRAKGASIKTYIEKGIFYEGTSCYGVDIIAL